MRYVYCLIALSFILSCTSNPPIPKRQHANEHFLLGDAYLKEGNILGALRELSLAKEADQDNPDIHHELGLVYMALDDYIKAKKEFERAISLRPNYSEAYNSFGLLYFRQGRWKKAEEYFKKALSNVLYATPEDAYTNLGFCYLVQKKYKKALAAFKSAIQNKRECAPAYLGMGQTLEAIGQDLEALNMYNLAAQYAPENPEVYYRLGNVCIKLGKRDDAIKAFKKAIALDPIGGWGRMAKSLLKDLD